MQATKWVLAIATMLTFSAQSAFSQGMLVPTDPQYRSCAITYQRVTATIRDQAAETRVEQEFRNDASVAIEAYYLFPLPEGAAVKDFAMTVDGKRVKGEVVEAGKAKQVYEDIVRRTKDPGLLEHMGKNLWRVRVFPVPARGKQKFELTYTEVVPRDAGVASYTYPLKASNTNVKIDGFFAVRLELHSSAALKSVYSPSHSVGVNREGDHKAIVGFEENNAVLNRDFQVFWTTDNRDVGLSLLTHRESPGDPGYFMLLVSPKVEVDKSARVPRDVVFVLDTSGSMREDKMAQARKALEFCLKGLDKSDRFGVIAFATTANPYERGLKSVNDDTIKSAVEWVRKLEAGGGTAISEALTEALRMRSSDSRNFTVVFLTDGQPTIGETDPRAILKSVDAAKNDQTRIFTFGVGDDVNTHLLDQIADHTRAASTYVRPKEDLEVKVSSFFDKISHPVLANLSIDIDGGQRFSDVYPPKLPDLFHGGQLVVMGRYTGNGDGNVRLKGKVGDKEKEFIYKVHLPVEKRELDFLPTLWARRKVGYLLDEIRLRGENKELRDEVIFLAKKHGIATPYTSYLVVPDGQFSPPRGPVVRGGIRGLHSGSDAANVAPDALGLDSVNEPSQRFGRGDALTPGSKSESGEQGGLGGGVKIAGKDSRVRSVDRTEMPPEQKSSVPSAGYRAQGGVSADEVLRRMNENRNESDKKVSLEKDVQEFKEGPSDAKPQIKYWEAAQQQAGGTAVDLSIALKRLKSADTNTLTQWGLQKRAGVEFVNLAGVWMSRSYQGGGKVVKIKYLSDAYFDIIAKVKSAKDVLSLGPKLIWELPNGTVLVIDATGEEKLSEANLVAITAPPKKNDKVEASVKPAEGKKSDK